VIDLEIPHLIVNLLMRVALITEDLVLRGDLFQVNLELLGSSLGRIDSPTCVLLTILHEFFNRVELS
jgi:hypothetical protein